MAESDASRCCGCCLAPLEGRGGEEVNREGTSELDAKEQKLCLSQISSFSEAAGNG